MSWFKKKTQNAPLELNGGAPAAPPAQKGGNPYLAARQEWLERYGSYISRAAQWRAVAVITLAIAVLSIFCNVLQAMQVKTVPYIIEVDKLGKAAVAARADQASAAPQRLIQAAIAACITDWRTVTADVTLQQQMIQRLSYYFAGSAKGVLKEWYAVNNPYEIAKAGKLVHIEIKGLPLPVSADSYRVEWEETLLSHAGVVLERTTFQATVSVQVNPPQTEAVLLHNPGGVYITEIAASKVFNAAAPAPHNAE